MVNHKPAVFGVHRKMVGGKMRVASGPRHRYVGGKMRWVTDALHKSVLAPYTVENPEVRNSLFKDNEKQLTGGSLSTRLAREYKHFMGSHGSGHKHKSHRSSMKGRGMHVY